MIHGMLVSSSVGVTGCGAHGVGLLKIRKNEGLWSVRIRGLYGMDGGQRTHLGLATGESGPDGHLIGYEKSENQW
jgi:hypothetical protein